MKVSGDRIKQTCDMSACVDLKQLAFTVATVPTEVPALLLAEEPEEAVPPELMEPKLPNLFSALGHCRTPSCHFQSTSRLAAGGDVWMLRAAAGDATLPERAPLC